MEQPRLRIAGEPSIHNLLSNLHQVKTDNL